MTEGNVDDPARDEVGELAREIRRVIDDNRRFLDRIMADDFAEEELPDDEAEMPAEEL